MSKIAPERIDEVRHLLAEGVLSERQIARCTGAARATVAEIATGKFFRRASRMPTIAAEADGEAEPIEPPDRCPTCGGMVYMPCRLCEARRRAEVAPPAL